jgi:hypothetical protein
MKLLMQLHLQLLLKHLLQWQHLWYLKLDWHFVGMDHSHGPPAIRKVELHLMIVGFEMEQ